MIGIYGWIAAGATALVLSALLFFAERRLDNAQDEIVRLKVDVNTLHTTLGRNEVVLSECKGINAANEAEAIAQAERAKIAADRLAELESSINRDIEDITHEVEAFRSELTCPALTADFREWVRND